MVVLLLHKWNIYEWFAQRYNISKTRWEYGWAFCKNKYKYKDSQISMKNNLKPYFFNIVIIVLFFFYLTRLFKFTNVALIYIVVYYFAKPYLTPRSVTFFGNYWTAKKMSDISGPLLLVHLLVSQQGHVIKIMPY